MDAQVAALLSAQGGVVGSHQVAALGVPQSELRRCVKDAELLRVRRGAFVDGALWRAGERDTQYGLAVMAVLRSRRDPAVASHHAALALHGLPLWHVDRNRIDLCGEVRKSTTSGGVTMTPLRPEFSIADLAGLRALSVPDAVVMASTSSVEAGVVAGDAALRGRLCEGVDIGLAAKRLTPGLRASQRVARMLSLLDGNSESVGESRTRLILLALGFTPRSQVEIRDRAGSFVARVDFLVGENVVIEFDGMVKYQGDEAAEAVIREKRREDRLRELGYQVLRVTWDELLKPALLKGRIRAAISRAAA